MEGLAENINSASEGTKMSEWNADVIKDIKTHLKSHDKAERLFALLKECGALISGGSILKSIVKYDALINVDIDIYVPTKNIPIFLQSLVKGNNPIIKATAYNKYEASIYCASFLRKNGIRKVYTFREGNDISIDVMSIRNKRNPLSVVNNFDLTFCQVWFDGSDVYASHPDHIKEKKGDLQKDYVLRLMLGNEYLKNRIHKYIKRGFIININTTNISLNHDITSMTRCYDDKDKEYGVDNEGERNVLKQRTEDKKFMKHWANKVALKWLCGIRNNIDDNGKGLLSVPLSQEHYFSNFKKVGSQNSKQTYNKGEYLIDLDDGYDSSDMNEDSLKDIAVSKFQAKEDDLAAIPIDPKLIYYRSITKLIENIYIIPYSSRHIDGRNSNITFLSMIDNEYVDKNKIKYYIAYLNAIKTHLLHNDSDMYGGDGEMFHLHNHPIEGGITQESLESYLTDHIKDVDKSSIPCFWAPTVPIPGQPIPSSNCKEKFKLSEIRSIVSQKFYKKFMNSTTKVKKGLNQTINAYDATLFNTKSMNASFGNIYHATVCPYCLQFEQREDGCAYISHANPKRLTATLSPFCENHFLIQELRDKYLRIARKLDPHGFDHLEFCVECGRPSTNHQHFDLLEEKLIAHKFIGEEADRRIDYGSCSGGGRPELYARILAIRKVYSEGIKDSIEERKKAALAADKAPLNEELMAQGKAIYEMEIDSRKWANTIPSSKKYNNNNNNNNNNNSEGGRRKTRRKQNKNKKTKKY